MKTDDEIINKINGTITDLVYPKFTLQKAYNYYYGKLDADQYRYLEENYGIGQPTSMAFVPLIKKHVDALLGEYIGLPILPKVSCRDSKTIQNISSDKQQAVSTGVYSYVQNKLEQSLVQFIEHGTTQGIFKKELDKVAADINDAFISNYEIAAQDIIEYITQSRQTDLSTKLATLFRDELITGTNYYRVKPSQAHNNINIEVLSPLNTFTDRNPNSPYIKDATRAVIRKWLSKDQILAEYGKDLSKEDIKDIQNLWDSNSFYAGSYYVRNQANSGIPNTEGLCAGQEITPGYPTGPYTKMNNLLIPVYEVEWLETDKDFVMQRYQGIRIGENVYIIRGLCDDVIRTVDNPNICTLSLNGVYVSDRGQEPYSLVLACASLQDKYNLLNFYRDNLIANSGTSGDWIDISLIPKQLGIEWPERVKKWLAYKKGGLGIIDTSQEGRLNTGQAPMNTIFNGFDDTVKVQAIQAIQLAIDAVEQTVSSITGVFKERLNGITAHDAVTNVQIGQANSYTVTKQHFQWMDLITSEMLTDCLNQAKIVYRKGITGVLILGETQQRIFTALPKYYTMTDYDVHVTTSTDIIKETEQIKQVIPELIKAGVDPSILVEALTAHSLTELKQKVSAAIKKQKEEQDVVGKLQQELEQAQQNVTQLQQQLSDAQTKIQTLEQASSEIEQKKIDLQAKTEWFKANTDRQYKSQMAQIQDDRTKIQAAQLRDGNPYNDKIKE